jgi:hypothetical protein
MQRFLAMWDARKVSLRHNPSPNPISISAEALAAMNPAEYVVAEKIDGVRYALVLCRDHVGEPVAVMINRACEQYQVRVCADASYFDGTLIDGELAWEVEERGHLTASRDSDPAPAGGVTKSGGAVAPAPFSPARDLAAGAAGGVFGEASYPLDPRCVSSQGGKEFSVEHARGGSAAAGLRENAPCQDATCQESPFAADGGSDGNHHSHGHSHSHDPSPIPNYNDDGDSDCSDGGDSDSDSDSDSNSDGDGDSDGDNGGRGDEREEGSDDGDDDVRLVYWAFDVACMRGCPTRSDPYLTRAAHLRVALHDPDGWPVLPPDVAEHHALRRANAGGIAPLHNPYALCFRPKPFLPVCQMDKFWPQDANGRRRCATHLADGLIFTPLHDPLPTGTFWRQFKWKEYHTVDLQLRGRRRAHDAQREAAAGGSGSGSSAPASPNAGGEGLLDQWVFGLYYVEADWTCAMAAPEDRIPPSAAGHHRAAAATGADLPPAGVNHGGDGHDGEGGHEPRQLNACEGLTYNNRTVYFVLRESPLLRRIVRAANRKAPGGRALHLSCICEVRIEFDGSERVICSIQKIRPDRNEPNNRYDIFVFHTREIVLLRALLLVFFSFFIFFLSLFFFLSLLFLFFFFSFLAFSSACDAVLLFLCPARGKLTSLTHALSLWGPPAIITKGIPSDSIS